MRWAKWESCDKRDVNLRDSKYKLDVPFPARGAANKSPPHTVG